MASQPNFKVSSASPKTRDPKRARSAATSGDRPGEDCKAAPGTWIPVVNRARCEGKRDCVAVCPYNVFEVRRIADAEYQTLPFLARIKLTLHGRQTAYT